MVTIWNKMPDEDSNELVGGSVMYYVQSKLHRIEIGTYLITRVTRACQISDIFKLTFEPRVVGV